MKYKMLIISPLVPYDNVGHAGGKIHNYYLKRFNSDEKFQVKLITFADMCEKPNIDLESYNVDSKIFFNKSGSLYKLKKNILYNFMNKINPYEKNAGFVDYYNKHLIIKYLNKLKKIGYYPDVIILTWTQVVLMINDVKKIYPLSKYIAIEHDVSYLSLYRKYMYEKNSIKKYFRLIKYKRLKKVETETLKNFDCVMPLNIKDMNLLIKENVDKYTKLDYICPYFSDLSFVKPKFEKNNIIFFGAMNRRENYESCIWFIESVFNKLLKIDKSFKFFIVGNKPDKCLDKYSSPNIIITGFVDNVDEYFNKSLCMVAPLIFGAGIKIKVLEGMSSGLPVLTNDIGIEGIPASPNEFMYCKNGDDYINSILLLKNNTNKAIEIGNNSKHFIRENFNLDKSYEKYRENVLQLAYKG